MATYAEVQRYVKLRHGFLLKTCWIPDVKAELGLTTRVAPNRIHTSRREVPCPPDKRAAIEDALRHFGMI
jgi:hypothetical protein